MGHIGFALSTAGDDYVVAGIDKPRDEERPDVTGAPDYDKSHRENVHFPFPIASVQWRTCRDDSLSLPFPPPGKPRAGGTSSRRRNDLHQARRTEVVRLWFRRRHRRIHTHGRPLAERHRSIHRVARDL